MMKYQNAAKSAGVAYLLWFFFGTLGGHRYYLGNVGLGVLMTVCFLAGLFLLVPLVVPLIICIYDLFTIPSQVRQFNSKVMVELVGGGVRT